MMDQALKIHWKKGRMQKICSSVIAMKEYKGLTFLRPSPRIPFWAMRRLVKYRTLQLWGERGAKWANIWGYHYCCARCDDGDRMHGVKRRRKCIEKKRKLRSPCPRRRSRDALLIKPVLQIVWICTACFRRLLNVSTSRSSYVPRPVDGRYMFRERWWLRYSPSQ